MNGALLSDFEQFRSLLGGECAGQFQLYINMIEKSHFGFTFSAVLGVNPRMPKTYDDSLKVPILSPGVHSYGHRSTCPKTREEKLIGGWTGVIAARTDC